MLRVYPNQSVFLDPPICWFGFIILSIVSFCRDNKPMKTNEQIDENHEILYDIVISSSLNFIPTTVTLFFKSSPHLLSVKVQTSQKHFYLQAQSLRERNIGVVIHDEQISTSPTFEKYFVYSVLANFVNFS